MPRHSPNFSKMKWIRNGFLPCQFSFLKKEEILHEALLGKSNIAQDISLADNHPFLIASISKIYTATALLQLVDDELLALNDPINDHLPFSVNHPDYNADITVKMLLTHTSGIDDGFNAVNGQYFFEEDSPNSLAGFMEDLLTPGGQYYDAADNFTNSEPGSRYAYSNTGSALIGVIVEEVSGMGFNDYCKQHIFTPLSLANTSWRLDELSGTIVQPYTLNSGDFTELQHYTFTDYPNGGLRTTSRDMHRFIQVFMNEGVSQGVTILNASSVEQMLTPQIEDLRQGQGLVTYVVNDTYSLWGHDGGESGVSTVMGFNPSIKVGAIVLANMEDANLERILREAYEFGLLF